MRDFYAAYYNAVESSRAHARFCEYVYGKDLAQHGFAAMDAVEALLRRTQLSAGQRVLDVGCGTGGIAETISDATGARVLGMDCIAQAVRAAQARTACKRMRLNYFCAELAEIPCTSKSLDLLLSVDSIYFGDDYATTLQEWARCVRTGGAVAIYFSHGANPQQPKATFDRSTLPPDKTPLGVALQRIDMRYRAWDLTTGDYMQAKRKCEILNTLQQDFASEGNVFLYENRIGEARGVIDAFESRMHARYLYLITVA